MNDSQRTLNALRLKQQSFAQWDDSILDYKVNWAGVFPDDPITASTWSQLQGNATFTNLTLTGNLASIRVEASAGNLIIINKVETTSGQFDSRVLFIKVRNKTSETILEAVTFGGEGVSFGGDYTGW
jgi:hypothetical protein